MEDMSITKKAVNINQKVPGSSIRPKNDTAGLTEKIADKRVTKTTAPPATKTFDLGNTTLPSENLATIQKMREITKPITKNKLLLVPTETFVKGRKKTGNSTTRENREIKESLLRIFGRIVF